MGPERQVDAAGEDAGLEPVGRVVDRGETGLVRLDPGQDSTGPKTSSPATFASTGTSVSTVGEMLAPSRTPPAKSLAPADSASPTQVSTRLAASSEIIGPTSVAASFGSPVRWAATASTSRLARAS